MPDPVAIYRDSDAVAAPLHITHTGSLGRAFIVAWEGGYRLRAYLCPVGVPTISAGVTRYPNGKRVQLGDVLSQPEAERLFDFTLLAYESAADDLTPDWLRQHQFDAVVSFLWNCGYGTAVRRASLFRYLASVNPIRPRCDPKMIADLLAPWCHGETDPGHPGLEVVPGLVRRRAAEARIFSEQVYLGPSGESLT
jgi:GH24 family phage-related lysozyme (muramidase)